MSVVCGNRASVNSATAICMQEARGQLEWVEDEWEVNSSLEVLCSS